VGGFLYGDEGGMIVQFCIFGSGTGPLIAMKEESRDSGFVVRNCVFSDSELPTGSWYSSTSDNRFNMPTPSREIGHLDLEYCRIPSATPTARATCFETSGEIKPRIAVPGTTFCAVVRDCIFADLTSSAQGGAIDFAATVSYVLVFTSTFRAVKTSGQRGGALYIASDDSEIYGCCFN
jgi:hypothetical protein